MRECVTHHHACECREAYFRSLEAKIEVYERLFAAIDAAMSGASVGRAGAQYKSLAEPTVEREDLQGKCTDGQRHEPYYVIDARWDHVIAAVICKKCGVDLAESEGE